MDIAETESVLVERHLNITRDEPLKIVTDTEEENETDREGENCDESIPDNSVKSPIRTVAESEIVTPLKLEKIDNLFEEASYEEKMCSGLTEELEKIPQTTDLLLNDELESLHNSLVIKSEPGLVHEAMVNGVVQPLVKQEPPDSYQPVVKNIANGNTENIKKSGETFVSKFGRRNKSTEARFQRKYEWGFYYEKYNISKSSTECIWDGCKFKGINSYALETHIRAVHEGILDFPCQYCGKGYRLAYPCQRHEAICKARKSSKSETTCDESYKCKHCDEVFDNKMALNAHRKLLHDTHNEMVSVPVGQIRANRGARKPSRYDSPTRVEQRKSSSPKNGEMRNRLPVRIKNEPGIEEIALDSSDEGSFCKLCGITPDDMEQHMMLRHQDHVQRFFCNVCDKNYTQKAHLKKHCMLHHGYSSEEFNLEYPRPGFRSISKTNFTSSSVKVRSTDTYKVSYPKNHPTKTPRKHSTTFEDLLHLKRRFTPESDTEVKEDYVCQVCGTIFDNQPDFTNHVQKKHRAKFRRSQELAPKRRVTLPLVRSDSIEKELFSESSSSGDSLESEATEEEFYPCRYCGRCFELKANRIVHERLHTGENPFQCTICQKSFSCFTYLITHLELTHNLLRG